MANKQTDWKDGNAFILNDGIRLTVCGQGRAWSQNGALVFATEYDDELKLIKNRDVWKDRLDVAKVISAKEIMPNEWDGKPIRGKAWNGSDGYKYSVIIIGYCHDRWVCEHANQCLGRFEHVECE